MNPFNYFTQAQKKLTCFNLFQSLHGEKVHWKLGDNLNDRLGDPVIL